MTPSIAKVPGIALTTPAFRAALWDTANRHHWNVDAIAAVISAESGFKPSARSSLPGQTAAGLLQWIDATAKRLFGMSADKVATLTAERQVPLIEKWFFATLGDGPHRPVDYYLVGWGSASGRPDSDILASSGDTLYKLNSALDVNHDGRITVSDLRAKVEAVLGSAGGGRIDASPLAVPSSDSSSSSAAWVGLSTSLLRTCPDVTMLAILRKGSTGPDVLYLRALVGCLASTGDVFVFDDGLHLAVRDYQLKNALVPDSVVGPKTWGVLKRSVGGS